ncbi:MAG: isochorismatase family protein [Planctomycetes bacterium]|nr:isochorismatase family protein [Planctomycetota bacterium]
MTRMRPVVWKLWARLLVLAGVFAGLCGGPTTAQSQEEPGGKHAFRLQIRKRVETSAGSKRYHAITEEVSWDPRRTAVVICDMWDKHWCAGATKRVGEMAARMNAVVAKARSQGALIIHCPSDTLDFYKDTPQRRLAQMAPAVETKRPLERWCRIDPTHESPLPIDDTDGGCDCSPQCKNYKAWSRQIDQIKVEPGDAITDSGEAYFLMRSRGIDNVIVMGVHTNMCVLGRPFSIRQMVYQGQNVVLMRDMTDTMYNSRMAPFVHHCTGTDLVIEHIEKHWCPTISSVDFLGGREFRFSEDRRPTVTFVVGEDEYKTEQSLPRFAAQHLGKDFRVNFVFSSDSNKYDFPGLDAIDQADVLFISVRRRVLPAAQLDRIRRFIAAGKPVVGIRTASHAFALRADMAAVPDTEAWPTFDPDVLGGHYTGHHGEGLAIAVKPAEGASDNPLLQGVALQELVPKGSLYKAGPLADSARALLIGSIPDQVAEPIAWTNTNKYGGRVFYTSLGHIGDFEQTSFKQLLVNALRWATSK